MGPGWIHFDVILDSMVVSTLKHRLTPRHRRTYIEAIQTRIPFLEIEVRETPILL